MTARDGDGLQTARAEAVDGHRSRLFGEPRQEARDARDVQALLALGHRATEDQVLDHLGLHVGDTREQRGDDFARELVGAALLERALVCATDGRANRICDDDFVESVHGGS